MKICKRGGLSPRFFCVLARTVGKTVRTRRFCISVTGVNRWPKGQELIPAGQEVLYTSIALGLGVLEVPNLEFVKVSWIFPRWENSQEDWIREYGGQPT